MRRIIVAIALLVNLVVLPGCKKQVACDPADSDEVCKAFQQCLRSDTSVEVCRMGEQDATSSKKTRSTDYPTKEVSQMKRTSLALAATLSIMPATIAHAQFG